MKPAGTKRIGRKKSRYGCSECKRRHIRCDENRPQCVNCQTIGRECSYMLTTSVFRKDLSTSPAASSEAATSDQGGKTSSKLGPEPQVAITVTPPQPNLIHMELLFNFTSNSLFFVDTSNMTDTLAQMTAVVFKHGLAHQFLMNEILAFSALHLSIHSADRKALFRKESAQLLDQALSAFHAQVGQINDNNYIPVFLFSSVLGFHFFCDTFNPDSNNLDHFLDQLVHSINILRGIHTVLRGWWRQLMESEIAPMIQPPDVDGEPEPGYNEFTQLQDLLKESDLPQAESQACREAAEKLLQIGQWRYQEGTDSVKKHLGRATAWSITQSAEYTALLSQRKPEALIILGYYAVLLHQVRSHWMVGGAGKFLLIAIEQALEEKWRSWLRWPKQIILSPELT